MDGPDGIVIMCLLACFAPDGELLTLCALFPPTFPQRARHFTFFFLSFVFGERDTPKSTFFFARLYFGSGVSWVMVDFVLGKTNGCCSCGLDAGVCAD